MFYPYFNKQLRIPAAYGGGITYSGAQSTIQAVQQALQAQQQMQQSIQPYYPVQYDYPMYTTQHGITFSTIPYGTEYNL
ncbi:DUF3947 family protein [Bacillus sp. JJ1127]|uniref:DUF3947 family protein n=1 Tax=Bacillus sp. JJ1127 TaxID=3122952 RepID=UPI0030000012